MMTYWGGVEAGGTKFVCAVGTGPENLMAKTTFDTGTPEETLSRVIDFFRSQGRQPGELKAVGVGSFGPVDLRKDSPTFGYITTTPKEDWVNTDFAGAIERGLGVPVNFDTDVNAAALAEHRWGAARALHTFIYLTVGTGIGGGGMINGRPAHGLLHPEMGHILIPHDFTEDPFPGVCPYHGDCLEGLASGPAILKRWGAGGDELAGDHPAWRLQAKYLALGLVNFICTISPQRIIMGGGVMHRKQLFPMIREKVLASLGGYIKAGEILDDIEGYIVPPLLGDEAGVLGGIALAMQISR
jgi:fructokinase